MYNTIKKSINWSLFPKHLINSIFKVTFVKLLLTCMKEKHSKLKDIFEPSYNVKPFSQKKNIKLYAYYLTHFDR